MSLGESTVMQHARPTFADLLEPLYASVLDAARFDEFAAGLRNAMDSHLVALQVEDDSHHHRIKQEFAESRFDQSARELNDDARINQYMLRGGSLIRSGNIINGAYLFGRGELERTAFYQDVLVPVDIFHSMGCMLSKDPSGEIVALSVSRSKRRPAFGEEEVQFLHRLMPHLRNVHALQQRLQKMQQMASSLDHLGMGVWLLDMQGKVVHANSPACEMLGDPGSGLRQRGLQLSATWHPDKIQLRRALGAAVQGSSRQRAELLLHDIRGQPWAVCSLQPLHTAGFDAWMLPEQAVALVFLRPFVQRAPASIDALRRVFDLTRAEAELARALLQHGSLSACCDASKKSIETLRTQLKSLFAKTGTRRQAGLLKHLQAVGA